jgi:hypothetical protein
MAKYNIDKDSILTEVKKYDLDRGPGLGRLIIDVHRVIAGGKLGLFFAVPNLVIGGTDPKYIAEGESEEEALTKCLELVKSVPSNKIIPDMGKTTAENT